MLDYSDEIKELDFMDALPKLSTYVYERTINEEAKTYTTIQIINGIKTGEVETPISLKSKQECIIATKNWYYEVSKDFNVMIRLMPEYKVVHDVMGLDPKHYIRLRVVLIPKEDN